MCHSWTALYSAHADNWPDLLVLSLLWPLWRSGQEGGETRRSVSATNVRGVSCHFQHFASVSVLQILKILGPASKKNK